MTSQSKILNEVKSLEAHFSAGLNLAIQLRKKLEGDSSPSGSRKGKRKEHVLTEHQKAGLRAGRGRTLINVMSKATIILLLLASCTISKQPKYKVRSIEHIKGNAYLVTTDSFTVIKYFRGIGKFPNSITR